MPKKQRIRVVVDEKTIATKDLQAIIDPVWFSANIYGSYKEYESSLSKFTRSQRIVLAMLWYLAEVNNGGHEQFYSNSTGIVWEDAQKGFEEIGALEVANIISESAKRMGGRPSFDREERNRVSEQRQPKFDDLDERIFEMDVEAKMIEYILARPKEFLFDGEIEKMAPK